MAGTDGQTPDPVIQKLEANPFGFDFFRAMRLLEAQWPEGPRFGYSSSPSQDPVRFCQNPSLRFAPSTIEKLKWNDGSVPKFYVRFMGLFGPNAPLPPHITEYAHERELHHDDYTLTGFFNMFHHRIISFFYRAWADNQKAMDLDRPDRQRYMTYLGSFFGLGLESLQEQDAVQDWSKLYFAGRLSNQTRNAEGLENILAEYFEIKSEVQTFVGRWLDLPSNSKCRLGESPETGCLGMTAIVGSKIWDCQLNFRIKLGPMKLKDFERMLPSGEAFQRLRQWVLNYCGQHFFWDIQMVLKKDEVRETSLGQFGRLGWTTWLKTLPFQHDAGDLILIPPQEQATSE